jgi:hypothetical protein
MSPIRVYAVFGKQYEVWNCSALRGFYTDLHSNLRLRGLTTLYMIDDFRDT